MDKLIYFIHYDGNGSPSLYRYTLVPALKNIAEQYGYDFIGSSMDTNLDIEIEKIPYTDKEVLFFVIHNINWHMLHYQKIKERMPNSKVIMFGGDVISLGANTITWPLDLFFGPNTTEVGMVKDKGIASEFFFWSVSETIIKLIESYNLNETKEHEGICLCSRGSGDRIKMFDTLNSLGCHILHCLNQHDFYEVAKLYARSWVALGTTTPVINDARTMKGFRDWIAPFCGSVLIYDDYKDIKDNMWGCVPMYEYGKWEQIPQLIQHLKKDLDVYKSTVEIQKCWGLLNTLEKQLISVLNKHNLL